MFVLLGVEPELESLWPQAQAAQALVGCALCLEGCAPECYVDVRTYVRYIKCMRRSATDLRAHLYEVLDHVAKTGEPVHVSRGGVELCIVRQSATPKKRKKPRVISKLIGGDPDALVHMEWPWSQGRDL